MKRIYFVLLFFFPTCFLNAQNIASNYTINGDIKGLKDDMIIMSINTGSTRFQNDTLTTKKGKFLFTGKVTSPTNAFIFTKNGRIGFSLFLEKGNITVNGNLNSSDREISITGTPDNNDLTELDAKETAAYSDVRRLNRDIKKAKNKNNSREVKELTRKRDEADEQADKERTKVRVQFIKGHPTSLASAAALYVVQDDISWQELNSLYYSVADNVRNNAFCRGITNKIAVKRRTDIGQMAPDFTINDIDGHPVSLSSFRGKYVLLDFWASWCVPCREENPNLVKAYNLFKDKGFTVIGVSLDNKADKWKEAVAKDGLSWTNVSDLKGLGGRVAQLYGVQPIPDNFLIDPQGKIIGRRLIGEELEKKLKEVLK